MASLKELLDMGERLGLKGSELKQFIETEAEKERQSKKEAMELERDEREKERRSKKEAMEHARFEKDREMETQLRIRQLELDNEIKIKEMEVITRDKEIELAKEKLQAAKRTTSGSGVELLPAGPGDEADNSTEHQVAWRRLPKIPPFDEQKDEIDAYLLRFERFATQIGWKRDDWTLYLSALLKGKALAVYSRLPTDEAEKYDVLKAELLCRFELTEEGFKKRFYNVNCETGESPAQFLTRLKNYLERWLELAKVERTAEALLDFFVQEQYLTTCSQELAMFLKERAPKDLTVVAELAKKFLDAHASSTTTADKNFGCKKDEQGASKTSWTGRQTGQRMQYSPRKGPGSPGRKRCYICDKPGHLAKNCYRRVKAAGFAPRGPNRFWPQTQTQFRPPPAEAGMHGSHDRTDASATDVKLRWAKVCEAHGREKCCECGVSVIAGQACGLLEQHEKTLQCGCKLAVLAGGGQKPDFDDRLPTFEGWVGSHRVTGMRDCGCTSVVVKRCLVDDDQLTGETVTCVRIDGTCAKFPTAEIEVRAPIFTGRVIAVCMERPMYDLIIGNVEGVKWNLGKIESERNFECLQAVTTRAQAKKQAEHNDRPLKVLEPLDFEITNEQLRKLQEEDPSLRDIWESQKNGQGKKDCSEFVSRHGILYRRKKSTAGYTELQLIVPTSLRKQVLSFGHDSVMSGHLGRKKTLDRIAAHFYWKGMTADVNRWCQSCDVCQRTEPRGRTVRVPLGHMPIIDTPFKRVAVDLVGPISPVTERGHRYILVMVDFATRYPEAVALKNIEAETVAEAMVTMFTRVGIPEEYLSDQGSQFMSEVMQRVSRLLSMKHLVSSPYHPACNGLVEKFNGVLKAMLRKMCFEKPKDWDRYLPAILFAYREVPQESLGFSPFELLYGRLVRGPMKILKEFWTREEVEPEVKTVYQYVLDLKQRLQDTCNLAHQELQKAKARQKVWYDRKARDRQFQSGEKVLLLLPTDNNKLLMAWKGPFEVIRRVSSCDYVIKFPGREKVFHINMLKKYHERGAEVRPDQDGETVTNLAGCSMECLCAIVEAADEEEEGRIDWINTVQTETYRDVVVNPELPTEIREKVDELLKEFQDIFTDVPGRTDLVEHKILLTSLDPVRSKPYPLPFATRAEVEKELDMMLELGIIEPSEAVYASPIVIVRKPDQSFRICVDFRKLNSQTVFDPEPMITAEEIFANLAGDRVFSKFDMSKGFWQIPIRLEDRDLTTLVCHKGLFRFKTMPFGLVGAPATFARMMRRLLKDLKRVHNYLDDVLAHTQNWSQQFVALREFFLRVRTAKLTLRPSKCSVGFSDIMYLGFILSEQGLRPSPEKIEKILHASTPVTKKQVRSFMGLVSYYRNFVPNLAEIASVLTDLTKHGAPNVVKWTELHEQSFCVLKQRLASTPILRLPDFSRVFIVQTDASDVGLGAALVQEYEGVKHPIAFASKKLLPRERAYAVVERECYAIVWAVEKFENYLYSKSFVLEVDHAPLQFLNRAKWHNCRVMRWSLILQQFKYVIRTIPGKENVCADFLSRSFSD